MSPPSTNPTCRRHEEAPGLAVCAECGADMCGACHGFDRRGFAVCPACRGDPDRSRPLWERGEDQYTPRAYARTIWQVIRHPRQFSERIPLEEGWLPALLFGFITMTVGLLVDRAWTLALQPEFLSTLTEYTEAAQDIPRDQLRLMVFLTTPVSVLLAGAVHIGALKAAVDIAGGSASWTGITRIAGYAFGSYLFFLIPPVAGFPIGRLLAIVWLFNLEASALQNHYGFEPWKATFTVVLPAMLLMVCGG
ncbi:MAG: YIP1 family protein [Bradymonadaceae bacterium]